MGAGGSRGCGVSAGMGFRVGKVPIDGSDSSLWGYKHRHLDLNSILKSSLSLLHTLSFLCVFPAAACVCKYS